MRTIFVADAHRGDGKRFVVYADELLTAFVELESTIRPCRIGLTSRRDFFKTDHANCAPKEVTSDVRKNRRKMRVRRRVSLPDTRAKRYIDEGR
jgi:hypothetical protein